LEWTRDSFEPIDAELIDTHIDSAFGTYYGDMQQVAVRFDTEIIPFIQERNWHDSQKFSLPEADGSVVMTFSASGLVDIMRWVMSYGSHAQALEPPALVSAIREEISRMGKAYC
jgi:proteasome accessory factor B